MGYETDLADDQWELVASLLPLPKPGGRPRTTCMRGAVNGLLYLLKTGCQWRQLPTEFPPWRTVYGYFAEWAARGVLRRIQQALYFQVRKEAGRNPLPSVAIIDSQSVKTGKMGGPRGYDGGKRVKGRKRHIVVDVLGLPIGVKVTPANVHDQRGGREALGKASRFLNDHPIKRLFADKGYDGEPFRQWVADFFNGAKVSIGENRTSPERGFVPDKKRWIVERSFSWIFDCRRLVIDYERTILHSQSMIRMAGIRLMLNRLAAPA